jgi:WD40 repeat protein
MICWLLFYTAHTGEGVASPLGESFATALGVEGHKLELALEGPRSEPFLDAARHGAQRAYDLLRGEQLLTRTVDIGFRLDGTLASAEGRSAGLAFALAFVASTLECVEPRVFPPFAATGVLDATGAIKRVEGLPAKLAAALAVLPAGALLIYPAANDGEVTNALRIGAQAKQITLLAVERLDEAIEALGVQLTRIYLDTPFRGLEAFEYRHRSLFYGRRAETEALVDRLCRQADAGRPGVLVIGASGTGKSSFVQAGVLPALERQARRDGRGVDWIVWRPREVDGAAGAGAWVASVGRAWAHVPLLENAGHALEATGLLQAADAYRRHPRTLVWVIDQLEELFTRGDEAIPLEAFFTFLSQLQARGVWILATLRDDFYADYLQHPALEASFHGDGVFNLKPLSGENLAQVIHGSIQATGYRYEDNVAGFTLGDRLLKDALAARDPLPLLQFTLTELFRRADPARKYLTWAAYEAFGGLDGAVASLAEDTLLQQPAEVQATLPRLLRQLVSFGYGEQPSARTAIRHAPELHAAAPLIDALLAPEVRLLTLEGEGQQLRVAHEALFRTWQRARALIEQSQADIRLMEQLRHDARQWQDLGETNDLLIPSGLRLQQARDLLARLGDELPAELRRLIERSGAVDAARQARGRRRTRLTIAVLSVLLVGSALAGFSLYQSLLAARVNEYLASARLLETDDPLRSQQLVLAAYRTLATDKTEAAVRHAYAQDGPVLQGHTGHVDHATFSPDDKTVITASDDGTARLWSAADGRLLATLEGHKGPVRHATFSPDGKTIVTAGSDGIARLWSTADGRLLATLEGHTGAVVHASFSSDGKTVVTASYDYTARLWNAADGRLLATLEGHTEFVVQVSFSPDDKTVVTTSSDSTARLWNAADGRPLATLEGHTGTVTKASFSPDDKTVVTASADGTARLWTAAGGRLIATLEGLTSGIVHAAFSPGGRTVMTASSDATVLLWNVADGNLLGSLHRGKREVTFASFSPDGKTGVTVTNDDTAQLWNTSDGQFFATLKGHKDIVSHAAFSSDGKTVVTASYDNTARLWNVAHRRPFTTLRGDEGTAYHATFSADGKTVVTASTDKTARLWSAADGSPLATLEGHTDAVVQASFSPDDKTVVTASDDGTARLWSAADGRPLATLKGHTSGIVHAAFSPDGKTVVTASTDNTARLWSAADGSPLATLEGHTEAVVQASFSPDDKTVVTASDDGTARLWSATDGRPLATLKGHTSGIVHAAFSPDGKTVVTASYDNTARLWKAEDGRSLATLDGHRGTVHHATFSPEGKTVVTASADATVRLWNAADGRFLSALQGNGMGVRHASFSPDGKTVITASDDGIARLWNAADSRSLATLDNNSDGVLHAAFSPDGKTVVTVTSQRTVDLWRCHVCEPADKLADLLEARLGNPTGGAPGTPSAQ